MVSLLSLLLSDEKKALSESEWMRKKIVIEGHGMINIIDFSKLRRRQIIYVHWA